VRYNFGRRRGRHLRPSNSMVATCARRKQRHDFESRWWYAACSGSWGRASLRASSTAILETSPEREPCGGFGGPRARERRAEWRVGGPRAREWVASVSVIFTSSGGRFGCNSSVALGPAWRRSFRCGAACPLVFLSVVVSAKVVLDICLSVVCWVELQLHFVFPVVVCV
jgi:hypothetical protein